MRPRSWAAMICGTCAVEFLQCSFRSYRSASLSVIRMGPIGPNLTPVPIIVSFDDKTISRHLPFAFAIIARFGALGLCMESSRMAMLLRQTA